MTHSKDEEHSWEHGEKVGRLSNRMSGNRYLGLLKRRFEVTFDKEW